MTRSTVLVAEDDAAIRRGVVDALVFSGYFALEAPDGERALELALGADCQLLLLDIVLPGRDGLEVLRAVRERRPSLPVILLTARGAEADRVRGLRLGADDYVPKPFGLRELLARVEAVLRRSPPLAAQAANFAFSGGTVDWVAAELRFADGTRAPLTDREARLLRFLAAQGERPVSRKELLVTVWGIDPEGMETRSVDMQIARLREKMRDDGNEPRVLLTERGRGYRLVGRMRAP